MPILLCCICTAFSPPIHIDPAAGASSTATTVAASDTEALEHARQGFQEAKAADLRAANAGNGTPAPPVRPALVRVNSVPVLSPKTPVERIRHNHTPDLEQQNMPNSATSKTTDPTEAEESIPAAPMDRAERKRLKKEHKREAKRQKKEEKKQKQMQQHHPEGLPENGTQPAASETSTGKPTPVPSDHAPVPTGSESGDPGHANVGAGEASTMPGSNAEQPKQESAPAMAPKPAAKKAAARPPPEVAMANGMGPEKVEQRTPARTDEQEDAARRQAISDNMQRANTESQLASPASTQAYEPDLEAALDREVKREQQDQPMPSVEGAAPPVQATMPTTLAVRQATPAVQQDAPAVQQAALAVQQAALAVQQAAPQVQQAAPQVQQPVASGALALQANATQGQQAAAPPPGQSQEALDQNNAEQEQQVQGRRRERTAAQKAAHARYMRFSRSFTRFSITIS